MTSYGRGLLVTTSDRLGYTSLMYKKVKFCNVNGYVLHMHFCVVTLILSKIVGLIFKKKDYLSKYLFGYK